MDKHDLLEMRRAYFVATGGGISLPAAGAIYWIALTIIGTQMSSWGLDGADWGLYAAIGSGAIFPLGVLLQGPLGSPFMKAKSPVGSLTLWAVLSINLLWPLHAIVIILLPEAAPLSLAIGMALHWPIVGWMYASKAVYMHAFVRVGAATGLWLAFPDERFTLVPLSVAVIYLVTAVLIALEVRLVRRTLDA